MNLNDKDIDRYSRNILLPEIGGEGQYKLLQAKVLVIGIGGLGSPLLMYLAAAGIGNITIIDSDKVELSNLQRQVIHSTYNIGKFKVDSAKNFIDQINPEINITKINSRIDEHNINDLISKNDIIADGSDNFKTRFLVADTCYKLKKTLVSAAITKYEGQISTWKNSKKLPCYRCLFANEPIDNNSNNCSSNGVLGSIGGVFGSLQATEIIKETLKIGNSLAGFLNIYDLLNNTFRKIKVIKDPNCKLCSGKKND
ncbi:MAG: adenylyltransferase [Rhodobacteraceae bacterium]|nr:adenylyltransferase [Paracoccaceae bacterium]OUU62537.1 MAG: adenylyltransferase [Alphaproteobacteria bacterium TMED62]